MSVLRFFSPARAFRDLRAFLSLQHKHRLVFLALSVGITSLLIAGFIKDSHFERAYYREIIFVEDWRLDRSEEEIVARQKILQAEKDKRIAEMKARLEKRQAEFKRLDDRLDSWGL